MALLTMETQATMDELWNLANTLRHQRKAASAKRLFHALNRRFPDTDRSKTALFLMGKITLTLTGDRNGAKQLFKRYLQEAPNGTLREEALGHLMEICHTLQDLDCAKRYASQYLGQYKGGVFTDRASSLISQ